MNLIKMLFAKSERPVEIGFDEEIQSEANDIYLLRYLEETNNEKVVEQDTLGFQRLKVFKN